MSKERFAAIVAEMKTLRSWSKAPTAEPVTLDGWYKCTDGTYAQFRWKGGRAIETLRLVSVESHDRFLQLDKEGADLFDKGFR